MRRILFAVVTGLGMFGAAPAFAGNPYGPEYVAVLVTEYVTVYETRTVSYTKPVVKYDYCGNPYTVYVTCYKDIQVAVQETGHRDQVRQGLLLRFRLAEVLLEEADAPGVIALQHHRIGGDHVREARQRQDLEVLAGPEQGVGQLQRVAEVDVVVGGAVDEQERTLQVFRQREQRRLLVRGLRLSGSRPR